MLLLLGAIFPHVHYTWFVPGTACGCGNPYPDGASAWYIGFAVVGSAVLVGYWMCAFWFCLARVSLQIGKDAVKPCPTPSEIEQQLRAQGYNPSIQDVMAIHLAKKAEQYENVALAVGWWALWTHIGHEARGRN